MTIDNCVDLIYPNTSRLKKMDIRQALISLPLNNLRSEESLAYVVGNTDIRFIDSPEYLLVKLNYEIDKFEENMKRENLKSDRDLSSLNEAIFDSECISGSKKECFACGLKPDINGHCHC